jgi:hypothetical protein
MYQTQANNDTLGRMQQKYSELVETEKSTKEKLSKSRNFVLKQLYLTRDSINHSKESVALKKTS